MSPHDKYKKLANDLDVTSCVLYYLLDIQGLGKGLVIDMIMTATPPAKLINEIFEYITTLDINTFIWDGCRYTLSSDSNIIFSIKTKK